LFEEDEKSISSCPDNAELNDDLEINNNVKVMVYKIVKELVEAEDEDINVIYADRVELVNSETMVPVEEKATDAPQLGCPGSLEIASQVDRPFSNVVDSLASDGLEIVAQDALSVQVPLVGVEMGQVADKLVQVSAVHNVEDTMLFRKRKYKSTSCSQQDARFSRSGPWSVEWFHNLKHSEVGLVSSKKKHLKKVMRDGEGNSKGSSHLASRKKAGGVLRHSVLTLKKVACYLAKNVLRK
jgi:hypothetical protein